METATQGSKTTVESVKSWITKDDFTWGAYEPEG